MQSLGSPSRLSFSLPPPGDRTHQGQNKTTSNAINTPYSSASLIQQGPHLSQSLPTGSCLTCLTCPSFWRPAGTHHLTDPLSRNARNRGPDGTKAWPGMARRGTTVNNWKDRRLSPYLAFGGISVGSSPETLWTCRLCLHMLFALPGSSVSSRRRSLKE